MHVIADNVLVKTIPSPVRAGHRGQLWGAGRVDEETTPPRVEPVRVQRKVSSEGTTRIGGQLLRLGTANRHTIGGITVHDTALHVHGLDGTTLAVIPRTSTTPITHLHASGSTGRIHQPPRTTRPEQRPDPSGGRPHG